MRTTIKIFASIILALTLNLIAQAKEWRGIIPLHSTRADVERILGQPSRPSRDAFSTYYLDEGLVQIFMRLMVILVPRIVRKQCLKVLF
jgi:hypothetical protein